MTEWRKVGESPRPMMARAAAEVQPLAQVVGDIPDVHVISVRERRVTVDYPTIIQNNVNTDTIELDLDGEWDDMSVVLVLGPCGGATELAWHGEPLTLPSALAEDTGGIDVSVVGYSADGDTRLVTVAAPSLLNVIKSGCTVGEAPGDETPDLIGQLVAAGDAANKAAQSANAAATSANKAAGAANTAASAANTAAGKADTAATKATDAATKATDAAGDATRAAQSADAAAEAAGAAAEAARGNVLKGTLGPAPVLSAGDAYATKPRRLTVYGNTRQNLWVNPRGTNNGVTVTRNDDDSLTVAGTNTAQSTVYIGVSCYALRDGATYTASIDKKPVGFSLSADYYNKDGYVGTAFSIVPSKATKATFTTDLSEATSVVFFVIVEPGVTVSGTYRVMLNEGSAAEPWCPPGLSSVSELSIVTAGKNLAIVEKIGTGPDSYNQLISTSLPEGRYTISGILRRGTAVNIKDGSSNGTLIKYVDSLPATLDVKNGQSLFANSYDTGECDATVNIISNLQLELGSTATAYEPPAVTSTPIDLDGHALNSLPDGTRDELTIDATGAVTLVQRVGAKVLPSDAASWKKDASGAALRYSTGISPDAVHNYVPGTVMSDALPPRVATDDMYDSTCIMAERNNAYASIGSDETAQTIASVCGDKTLLYPLATPQTIPLTPVTLPTLPSPNITVYHDSDVPSDITVEYERDVTIAFDKLQAQVSATTVREATNG